VLGKLRLPIEVCLDGVIGPRQLHVLCAQDVLSRVGRGAVDVTSYYRYITKSFAEFTSKVMCVCLCECVSACMYVCMYVICMDISAAA